MTDGDVAQPAGFAEKVRANQARLAANLHASYDYIVCGSGSSGSVVARRLAEGCLSCRIGNRPYSFVP